MNRRKVALIGAGFLVAVLLLATASGILVLRSGWLREQIRQGLIAGLETATGGRVELGSFQFDWKQMRVELRQFALHGNESAGKPALVRASSITAGLTIVSLFRRQFDLRQLDVKGPRVYLIVYPDGRTNVPEPHIKRASERTAFDTLINLAIGRFSLEHGVFELEGRARIPFDVRGRNLAANFAYKFASNCYLGELSVQPLDLQWDGQTPAPLGVRLAATLERDRIELTSARLTTGDSAVDFSGSVEDLLAPRASFRYRARISAGDAGRMLRVPGLVRGAAQLTGKAEWKQGAAYLLSGNFRAAGIEFRQPPRELRNLSAEGVLRLDAKGASLSEVVLSGESAIGRQLIPVEGRFAAIELHRKDLDIRGATLAALGAKFTGDARVADYDRVRVSGLVGGLEARKAVALYSHELLPWDSVISGPMAVQGSIGRGSDLHISADLTLAPASHGPPVRGQIAASYDTRTGAVCFARSTLALPASRVDLSGSVGGQMRVHLDTRDLNDFLPALGDRAASIPLKLENGSLRFDGTVTGTLPDPEIVGHLTLTRFVYAGRSFDSLDTDAHASPQLARFEHAALARGAARAQLELTFGLDKWEAAGAGSISGNAAVRNLPMADLLQLAGAQGAPLTGVITATGQVSGSFGTPQFAGDVEVVKGSFNGEPFDRIRARLADSGRSLHLESGQLVAAGSNVRFAGSFNHTPNRFDDGHVRFEIQSNAVPLDQIRALQRARPGLQGTLEIAASGAIDLAPGRSAAPNWRLVELEADLTGRSLQMNDQPLRDAHLTAHSEGGVLRAHLDSSFANSAVQGDGEWRLEGDYPGSAAITFSRLDLADLKQWIAPSGSHGPPGFGGFAQGELRINGPALKPELMKADLRIPTLEIRPAANPGAFALRNSAPIVASIANSTITLESAKLAGRSTELAVTGKISLAQRAPLDLRVSGHVDLGILDALNPGIGSSGTVTAEAGVRGSLTDPQVNGRLELRDASFNYADLPNGITNAHGVILFTGAQATIQSLQGDTGGGRIDLSGFAGYSGGSAVFRLHADGKQVRIRYPEGVSTVADANLDLTGTSERSMLAGTLTVRRESFNLQSDFSALLAKSAQPVFTPPARTGLLAGLSYDVQIQTAPDVEFESALTQGLQAEANLRLRGTASNPALLGRINLTQGQVIFFGTRYTINQGSVSFFNPARVEPVLNVDLETRARGIDITMSVSGPLGNLNLTPRSDPPLQFSEIVSVLTTGQNPTSDTTMRLGQQAPPQPFQQSSASALLGQALASPVSGRLQRFFGVSKLRIDPTLPGVEYNPQARLTLEQQVTPDITFTYITNVTNANPQVVSVEWAVSKQWSVYALREENGLFGLDFFFKKRFK